MEAATPEGRGVEPQARVHLGTGHDGWFLVLHLSQEVCESIGPKQSDPCEGGDGDGGPGPLS